jgi:hypothetical protein
MSIAVPPPAHITPDRRIFEDLVTALASYAALTTGLLTHSSGIPFRFQKGGPLELMKLGRLTERRDNSTTAIVVNPASILTALTNNEWPTSLDLVFEKYLPPPPTLLGTRLGAQRRVTDNIIEHAFIAYYARHEDEINAARGKLGPGGHPTLAFACAIRNAFAHRGAIHFEGRKKSANVTVTWRGLSFSTQDHGEPVMGKYMGTGDVVLLMLDMDPLF